jgi:transcriptional repressor NrdR
MVCVQCGQKTKVINSRLRHRSNQIWRRRQCLNCRAIFSTSEMADYSAAWQVRDSSDRLTPFLRDKLFLSIHNSCLHRTTALTDASSLTDTIIKRLLAQVSSSTISSAAIISTAQVTLNRFDSAASIHYQSFHRS